MRYLRLMVMVDYPYNPDNYDSAADINGAAEIDQEMYENDPDALMEMLSGMDGYKVVVKPKPEPRG